MSNQGLNDKDALELIVKRQESEATLSWSRNSYFLVVLSLLTLAYSQKPTDIASQLAFYKILISSAGIFLAFIWLGIQRRSSSYVDYYKKQANILSAKTKTPLFYPPKDEVKGFEMRRLVYWLPISFIVLLSLFVISQVIFFFHLFGMSVLFAIG